MSSTFVETFVSIGDLLSPVCVELSMFLLAAACYVAFAGVPVALSGKHAAKKTVGSPRRSKAVVKAVPMPEKKELTDEPVVPCKNEPAQTVPRAASDNLYTLAKAISSLGKEGKLQNAIRVFDKLKASEQQPNALVYNCLLDACVQCQQQATALAYFAEVKAAGLADVVSYNTVMKGFLLKGDMDASLGLLEEMLSSGLPANRITFHALLNVFAQRGDCRAVWDLLQRMDSLGLEATAVTCSILLKAVTNPSQTSDLKRIFALVDKCDQPAEEALFASIVEACIRSRNLGLLIERKRVFTKVGGDISKLNSASFGSMIKAQGQAKNLQAVWELWGEMQSQELIPTAITLGCMIEALVMNDRTTDAWTLVNQIWSDERQRQSVNTVIYSTILKGFAMAKAHDKVTAVYDEMKARGIPRNTITYNTILNAFARSGLMDRVPELLEEMRTAEERADPDLVTYSTIIKGYCQSGAVDKALSLFREMQREAGLTPDEVMYNSLLDGCARESRLQDALGLLDEMRKAKIAPSSYTLSIVCKLLGRSKRLDQAFTLVESVSKEHGFVPSIHVYTCLIQACFHNRQIGKALSLHDEVVRKGVMPDEKTYTAMVLGCLKNGSVEKAVLVARCAYHVPCHGSLEHTKGAPHGVDAKCLKDLLAAFSKHAGAAAAAQLEKEVRQRESSVRGAARRW